MNKKIIGVIALVVVVMAAWFLLRDSIKSGNAAAQNADKNRGVPVMAATVEQMDVPLSINVVGNVEALSSVTVKSRVDGQIHDVYFREGQFVTKGQKLFQIDSRSFEAVLRQAEANLARDQAQFEKSRNDVARYTDLQQKGFISVEKLSEIKTAAAAAEAAVKADSAARDLAHLQLSYSTVTSPLNGYAGNLQVQVGSTVKANDTNLIVINQTNPIYATFSVPENKLAQIKQDMKKNPPKVSINLSADRSTSFEGKLVFIDNEVNSSTGTIQMKALINNSGNQLTPGQFVNVSLVAQTLQNALVVPAQAIQSGPDGTFVFIIKEGKAEMRPINVIFTNNERAVMAGGLTPGEQVITDGQLRVTPGGKVDVKQSAEAAKDKSGKKEK
jgi:multidrug efflux system membrane fusion protein